MKRMLQVVAAVLGGAALLAIGIVVGTRVNPGPEQVLAAASAQSPLNQQDQLLMQAFSAASRDFDALLAKARRGDRSVGPAMTKQAVIVLSVKRSAENPALREAADAAAQAMLLMGAGLTANNGGAVSDGVEAYQQAQQKVVELGAELNGGQAPAPAVPPVPSESPATPAPSGSTTP